MPRGNTAAPVTDDPNRHGPLVAPLVWLGGHKIYKRAGRPFYRRIDLLFLSRRSGILAHRALRGRESFDVRYLACDARMVHSVELATRKD